MRLCSAILFAACTREIISAQAAGRRHGEVKVDSRLFGVVGGLLLLGGDYGLEVLLPALLAIGAAAAGRCAGQLGDCLLCLVRYGFFDIGAIHDE